MPRQARRKSESGIYHIMLRGINQQQIFEDEEDSLRFLETISKYKKQRDKRTVPLAMAKNVMSTI